MSGAASKAVTRWDRRRAAVRLGHEIRTVRFFLFADVLADLLQLDPDGGGGITPGPEMLPREVSLLAAQSSCGGTALPLEKTDHRGPRVLGGNCYAHMQVIRHQVPIQHLALFLPSQSVKDVSQGSASLSEQHLAPSVGEEYDMVFTVPSEMG